MGLVTDATGMTATPGRVNGALGARVVADVEVSETHACARCGSPIVRRRRTARQDPSLCTPCDQRERRAAYFRTYYEEHRDRILDKNRRWARDNKTKIVQLRQARRAREQGVLAEDRRCLSCGVTVIRAERCRRCYIRYRYATDPSYRERRLETTRRWLLKRQRAAILPHVTAASTLAGH
jgi:predicted RNA-binding Zn-ribbon protein involved in translation (DUF1610 family)